jgi:serine/threonine protein kinase
MPTPEPGCPDANIFAALVDGLLDATERAALDAHLDTCAACQALAIALGSSLADGDGEQTATYIGRYRVARLVGQGGQGVVYEAVDDTLGRSVAIKLLHPALTSEASRDIADARMLREAKLLATVHHPNVLMILDIGTWREQLYLVTEFIRGETLDAWIQTRGLSWRQIVSCYEDAARGLRAAHQRGVIHRDLKPSNILVDADGRVVLTDFGLATRSQDPSDPQLSLTREGAILGTPAYMAPEQHLGAEADARSDIFSLSASLYASLHGQRPFAGDTPQQVALRACAGELAPPTRTDLPPALHDLIKRSLSPDPASRPADLDQWLAQLSAATSIRSPSDRRSHTIIGAALTLLGATIMLSTAPTLPSKPPASEDLPHNTHAEITPKPDAPTEPPRAAPQPTQASEDRPANKQPTSQPRAKPARKITAQVAASDEQGATRLLNEAMEAARRHDVAACDRASGRLPADHTSAGLANGMCQLIKGNCERGEDMIRAYYVSAMGGEQAASAAASTRRGLCRPALGDAAWLSWSLEPIYYAGESSARCVQKSERLRALLGSTAARDAIRSADEALVRRALDASLTCLRSAPQAPCDLVTEIIALRAPLPNASVTLEQLAPRCARP